MKKYLHIYKTTLIESIQYISSTFINFISFFIMIYVFINLWQYVYNDPAELINGYSVNQMIWYVLFGELLWFGTRNRTLTNQINFDIKTGNIAYNINKPYNYVVYMIVRYLGEITIKLIVFLILGIAMGEIFVGRIPGFNFVNIPLIAISIFLGILINSIIRMCISVLSFWVEDSTPFEWVYNKIILLLGILFPIEMFPKVMQPFLKFTPVYVVNYGPIKSILNFDFNSFINIIIAQVLYLIVVMIILFALYAKGVKRVNVNGG